MVIVTENQALRSWMVHLHVHLICNKEFSEIHSIVYWIPHGNKVTFPENGSKMNSRNSQVLSMKMSLRGKGHSSPIPDDKRDLG